MFCNCRYFTFLFLHLKHPKCLDCTIRFAAVTCEFTILRVPISLNSVSVEFHLLICFIVSEVDASQCSLQSVVKSKSNVRKLLKIKIYLILLHLLYLWAEWGTPVSVVSKSGLNSALTELESSNWLYTVPFFMAGKICFMIHSLISANNMKV
ncbi:hypothetical protein L1987_77726 [Smallanthus sonchifolius]|uniref:Uncharacterized protein n=1 Tax=Smallanthus sonchifolius TaxID=185202 RepID=A0ACB8ZB74_9ASTR|nr:hypothetical protein L1987_77726 [Smallanthus sonchifolius]